MMNREGWHRCLSWWCLLWLLRSELAIAKPMSHPIVQPEIMTLEDLAPSVQPQGTISMWRSAPFLLNLQSALPALPGAMFDGPDPGRTQGNPIIASHQLLVYVLDDQGPSPNIINIPESPCPSGYRRDTRNVCRIILGLGYGPNPFHSFQPENFKGDLQFYMGLKVGRPSSRPSRPFRRRPRLRGRARRPGVLQGSAKLSPAVGPIRADIQPAEVQQKLNQEENNKNNDNNNDNNNNDDDDD